MFSHLIQRIHSHFKHVYSPKARTPALAYVIGPSTGPSVHAPPKEKFNTHTTTNNHENKTKKVFRCGN